MALPISEKTFRSVVVKKTKRLKIHVVGAWPVTTGDGYII